MNPKQSQTQDTQLINLIQTDPDAGINQLIRDRSGVIIAAVRSCGIPLDDHTADELLADIRVFVWLNAHKFDATKGTLNSWLIGVAYRTAITLHRMKPLTITPDHIGAIQYTPQSRSSSSSRAQSRAVRRVIHEMSPRQRAVVIADQVSTNGRGDTKELCAQLGCSRNALYDIRHRAHKKIKSQRKRFGL